MSFRILCAAALFTLPAACGPRDRRFDPSHFVDAGAGAPPQVVLPPHTQPGAHIFGIITSKPSDNGLCCAASEHVRLPVRKDGPARTLRIGVYTAPNTRARLSVVFPDGKTASAAVTHDHFSTLAFGVPHDLRAKRGIVRLRIDANAPYTLTSIYFE